MKKYLMIMAASAAVLFASCSANDDVVENIQTSSSNAIAFNAVNNNAQSTRASIIDSEATFKTNNFKVYSYTSNDEGKTEEVNFMPGIQIKWFDNKEWDYADGKQYYWPASGSLNFYAISPAKDNINEKLKLINYSVEDEYAEGSTKENFDVMFASKLNQTRTSSGGAVKLEFKHILSQVVFKARTENNTMTATVKSITIHNAANYGAYYFSKGWYGVNTRVKGHKFTVPVKNGVVDKNGTTSLTTDAEGKEYPMLMVPQTITGWNTNYGISNANDNIQAYLEIVCNVKQNGVDILGSEAEMKTIYVPFSINWEAGYKYCYTLVFGGGYDESGKQQDNLKPITFDVEKVTDWVEKDNEDIKF